MKTLLRKFVASGMLAMVFATSAVGILSLPNAARADVPTATVADAPRFAEWLLKALKYIGENALLASITTALINTVTYAADRLAYDAAVFIASGGDGDDPLFENRSVGEYFADYGASVAADALGQIDDSGILGNFSLCEPVLPEVTLAFKFGLKGAFQRPQPACNFQDVQENWTGFYTDIVSSTYSPFEKNSQILTALADAYNPKENDFSVGILLYTDVLNKAQQDAFLAAQRKLFGGFFEDKTDFITGRVETPAEVLQDNFRTALEATDETKRQVALQSLGDSNVLFQIGVHAGSVFTNTLLSKFTEKLYNGLFGGLDQTDINPFDVSSLGGTTDARETYRSFLTATVFSVQNYSILDDFGACPYVGKGLYNCVADASLISAVSRADGGTAVTVAEALEEGLLHGSWPLIPSSDTARDQDIYCYTYGYCHGNLVKLRKARIISTGWELAAESTANSDSSPVTLEEVVNGFYDCNDQNELDDNHPWCHLIDPNWVLKYPETQCKNQAYGQILESSVSDQRKTECVDMPSCIDEDGDGNCTGGYGYCVREENVWNFRGEECPDYYGSCTTYENPSGDEVNFLSNTTDASVCTADSAGCLWYNTQKESADGETYDWPDYTAAADLAAAEAATDIYQNRIYFTAEVEDCAAEDAGCRELVSRENGTTLNMIVNPSFEADEDDDGVPDGWFVAGTGETYDESAAHMLNGTDAVNPGASGIYYQRGIVLTPAAEYTFSYYAAQSTSGATAEGIIALQASNGETIDFRGYGLDGDCAVDSSDFSLIEVTGTPTDTDYERFSCTFTVPTLADSSAEITAFVDILFANVWVDAVQLEQESSATEFHEEYSDAVLDLAYVKVPPTYLGCTGTADDPEACNDYAGICSGTDVGCSAYTPTNGDPAVTGIANTLDVCPEECVGYDTFKQEPTRYEPDGDFPIYFIPDSAEQCTAQYVGCDEFTNIATEEPAYFTYVRACVTSDQADANIATSDAGAVFYTWEGSDTDGYQLKTWNLLESDMGGSTYTYAESGGTDDAPGLAPCTSWSTTDDGITCNDDSVVANTLDEESASCDEHDDTITNPDCREFYDTEGTIHYREWTDTVTVNDDCVTYRKTTIVGADTATQTSNCEESGGYFDSGTAECRYYGYAEESYECPAAESGCREYTGGRSRNSRQAFVEYFEDGDLTQWGAVSATDVTLSNESIATDGHSLYSDAEPVWTYVGGDGTECATAGGCETTEGALGATCVLAEGETYCGTLSDDVFSGKTYVVSFWAKGTGTLSVGFDTSWTSGTPAIDAGFATGTDAITLNADWQQYSYGPKDMNEATYPDFGDAASALVFTPGSGTTFYIDNVVLREGEDNIDVIQNSWVTPASCDETEGGTASEQYMLGCQEYTDQNGDTAYLKSFSELCDESKVGCAAYFMTQESDAVGGAVYGALCSTLDGAAVTTATSCYYSQNSTGTDYDTTSEYLCTIGVGQSSCEFNLDWYVPVDDLEDHLSYVASTVVSPADKDIFLVVNTDVECSSDVAGCMEVGLPVFSQDHTAVESWETTYLMNTPADYASTLCSQDELFCQAWTDNDGSLSYFKDPQSQTCEYRSDVTVGNVTYNGWFKTDTEPPELCDPDYVIGGDEAGIWRNGDDAYAGWVGECIAKYDSCSEFQDVSDLATDDLYGEADGTSYFYMNNDALEENSLPDSQKCNGEVSQTDGCGIFNDTSNPDKTASATATYMASTHADALFGAQQNDFVDPIDCDAGAASSTITTPSGESVDLCANRCWYNASDYYDINGSSESYVYDGSCYDDTDCRPLTSESGAEVTGFCASSYGGTNAPRLENESNIVLKVNRDRECSEWLSCSDAQTTWDERTNSYVTICGDIGLCTQYSGTSDASFCSAWKDNGAAVVLDVDEYSSRDVSWYGDDYSGYAIPGLLPVDQLTQVNVADPNLMTCDTADAGSAALIVTDGDVCEDDTDCGSTSSGNTYCKANTDSDYRLAYVAGSCEGQEYGTNCSVGYCENTGSSCVDTDACGTDGGSCLIGTYYAVSTDLCASSADCSTGETCLGGYCATDEGDVEMGECTADACLPSGISFYPSVNYSTGTCMYDQCVLTPDGSTFSVNSSEAKECRAYPEINSPFDNEIVTVWQDPTDLSAPSVDNPTIDDTTNITNLDAVPISFVQNFENVQTCALGEDCLCSYKKVAYGDGGSVRYFGSDVDESNLDYGVCDTGLEGSFCMSDDDCDTATGDGTCQFPSQIDDALGLDGYCLERDSSTNILGDRDLNACLTWLPIDQLAGSTDMYAKYTTAGYTTGETEYCSYISLYANPGSSHYEPDDVTPANENEDSGFGTACIEFASNDADGTTTYDEEDDGFEGCVSENPEWRCPMGYYAIVGRPVYEDSDGNMHGESYSANVCNNGGADRDCPFMCVPLNAGTTADGGTCEPPEGWQSHTQTIPASYGNSYEYTDYEVTAYYTNTFGDFDDAAEERMDCYARGTEVYPVAQDYLDQDNCGLNGSSGSAMVNGTPVAFAYTTSSRSSSRDKQYMSNVTMIQDCWTGGGGSTPYAGYYNLHFDVGYYLGCSDIVQTEDGNSSGNEGAPWTDRLLNPNTDYQLVTYDSEKGTDDASYDIDYGFMVDASKFEYSKETLVFPYGKVETEPSAVQSDARPAAIPVCTLEEADSSTLTYYKIFYSPTLSSTDGSSLTCADSGSTGTYFDATNPEARAFVDYYGLVYYGGDNTYMDDNTAEIEYFGLDSSWRGRAAQYDSPINGLIDQIFATRIDTLSFEDGFDISNPSETTTDGYESLGNDQNLSQYWDVRPTYGNPPSVWAVDVDRCYEENCEEDPDHALTLNDQNEGDIESDMFYRAYLKFYAAADKNQLPIRRVIVDWGDDPAHAEFTGSDSDDNFYKNHRGLEDDQETSICDKPTTDSDYEWGMSTESCDPNYFSYNHIYTCNPSHMTETCSDTDGDGIYDNAPCTLDGNQCVFRPRVHIQDNWGWCTGTCVSSSAIDDDDTDGCWIGEGYELGDSNELSSECAFERYPHNNPTLGVDPWVYYDGTITVTP